MESIDGRCINNVDSEIFQEKTDDSLNAFCMPLNLFALWLCLLNSRWITNGHWISTFCAFDTLRYLHVIFSYIDTLFLAICHVFHQPLFLWMKILVEFYEDIPPLFALQTAIEVLILIDQKRTNICITIYQTGIFSHIFNSDWDNIIKLLHLPKIDECNGWFSPVWEIK